jgi:hypothetical protein
MALIDRLASNPERTLRGNEEINRNNQWAMIAIIGS